MKPPPTRAAAPAEAAGAVVATTCTKPKGREGGGAEGGGQGRHAEVAAKLEALKRDKQRAKQHQNAASQAQAKVLEDLALLSGASKGAGAAAEEMEEWRPPQGQTGNGRTSLNDKLGY